MSAWIPNDFQGEFSPLDPLPPTLLSPFRPLFLTPVCLSVCLFLSCVFAFCFLEIIAEARSGRIHILDPDRDRSCCCQILAEDLEARSLPLSLPDSSCKITRVRTLQRRRVYSRKIALACTVRERERERAMCIRTLYICIYTPSFSSSMPRRSKTGATVKVHTHPASRMYLASSNIARGARFAFAQRHLRSSCSTSR